MNTSTLFLDCKVDDVKTPEEFLNKYYRPERYTGRGKEYAEYLLAHYKEDFETYGFVVISHFDSVTGKVVSLFAGE